MEASSSETKTKKKKKKEKKKEKKEKNDGEGVDVEMMDADLQKEGQEGDADADAEEWDGTEEMRKRKLDEYMEELYKLEFNDMVRRPFYSLKTFDRSPPTNRLETPQPASTTPKSNPPRLPLPQQK